MGEGVVYPLLVTADKIFGERPRSAKLIDNSQIG
jgi:hypothetical protein